MRTVTFDDTGGYDCLTAAFHVIDEAGQTIITVDCRHFGQQNCQPLMPDVFQAAQTLARQIAVLPDLMLFAELVANGAHPGAPLQAHARQTLERIKR